MAFRDDEISVQLSRPIETYTIVLGATTFRYTSYQTDKTLGGNLYTAIPIRRTSQQVKGSPDQPEVEIRMLAASGLAQALLAGLMPLQGLTVTITRWQQNSGESEQLWTGYAQPAVARGRELILKLPTKMTDPLLSNVPRAICQTWCNHVLYDARCNRNGKANRADWDIATTVVDVDGYTITVASVDGKPDGWLVAGEAVIGLERRLIVGHAGAVVTLDVPFPASLVPDPIIVPPAITLYAGCDHTYEGPNGCGPKFDNRANFGGDPRLDFKNPFTKRYAWK